MRCNICERGCLLPEAGTGACGLYSRIGREIVELYPDRYLIICPISIETMPLLHFYPGGKFLQISTAGCNFNCDGCISAAIVKEMDPASRAFHHLSPEQVVDEAVRNDCIGITFLMNDPLASFLTFINVAEAAKARGLLVGCSSNGYFTEASLDKIIKLLDFVNIGVKGMSGEAYSRCGGDTPAPVLRNIERFYQSGVHVEVSCICSKGHNQEILILADYLANISADIPLQVMRFIPVEGAELALEESIRKAEGLRDMLREKLNYVYLFNSPGAEYLNTLCPGCGELILKRDFYGPMGAKLKPAGLGLGEKNCCPRCGRELNIKGFVAKKVYQEGDFQGGYPFTRALEMMEAILIAMGVREQQKVVRIWEDVLCNNNLGKFHDDIRTPRAYIKTIRHFGGLIGLEDKAEALAKYLEEKLLLIESGLRTVDRKPRVYYAMGKPNFCIKGGRLENQLVETAGGTSVNREIDCEGRPGMSITLEQLEALNPEIIFISSFMSSPVDDFYEECLKACLDVEAVKNKRIYNLPAPCWDFGSPRWVLGLMFIANIIHPGIFHFDVLAEAKVFYDKFYGMEFSLSDTNLSFGKPSCSFKWDTQPEMLKKGGETCRQTLSLSPSAL
ncbi:Benzylsuccinate synthase activating enzyme [Pelotomaculum schinkii]|uniref:Benzylsuccinate synthase activating enzyme n=1 Tax=Pelotomaculum schinkii TaxID=78350 RepID=A0A4Y7RCL2_9FIRM|nr:radical SAM protein [Pelotomaculum schinkii]TEB06057.1 Benzylsuccinate synthase activating enzyme [Pelotomaculum schinkii]